MIEKIELIVKRDADHVIDYNPLKEKWIDLDGSKTIYLRVIYGDSRPITDINFYRIPYQKDRPDKMVSSIFATQPCAANSGQSRHRTGAHQSLWRPGR